MPPQEISSFIITNNPGCPPDIKREDIRLLSALSFAQSIRGSRGNAMRIAYMLVCVSGDIISIDFCDAAGVGVEADSRRVGC